MECSGSSILKVDAKGRVFLPRRFLESDEAKDGTKQVLSCFWLTPGLDGCVWLLDQAEWRRTQRRLRHMEVGTSALRGVQRLFYERADRVRPDSQGRVLIPEAHRKLAGIAREARLLGVGRRIEIWSPQRYAKWRASAEAQFTTDLEAILSGEGGSV